MVEPEVAYGTVDDMMDLAERFISFIVHRVLERRQAELKVLERDPSKLEKIVPPFPRVSYDEAVKIAQQHGSELQWGSDFGGGDETIISQQFDKPVMVELFPGGNAHVLGFVTQETLSQLGYDTMVSVYVPQSYHWAGQVFVFPAHVIKRLDAPSSAVMAFTTFVAFFC